MHDDVVGHVVTVQEEFVFKFLSHAEESDFVDAQTQLGNLLCTDHLDVLLLHRFNRRCVRSVDVMRPNGKVSHFYSVRLLLRGLLLAHIVHHVVDVEVVWALDATDWHSVVHTSRVDGGSQRVLGKLKLGCLN